MFTGIVTSVGRLRALGIPIATLVLSVAAACQSGDAHSEQRHTVCSSPLRGHRGYVLAAKELYVLSPVQESKAIGWIGHSEVFRLNGEQLKALGVPLTTPAQLVRVASYSSYGPGVQPAAALSAEFDPASGRLIITSFSLGGSRPGVQLMIVRLKDNIRVVRNECAGAR